MGGDYSSEPISGSKILLLTPISHIVVRFLYFDLADGDYLNLTLTTREETVGSVYFCGGRELDLSESISLYSGQLEGELVFSFNSTNKSNSSGFLIEYSGLTYISFIQPHILWSVEFYFGFLGKTEGYLT